MTSPGPDDPLHESTLTDAERWELLNRCLVLASRAPREGSSITGVQDVYCVIDDIYRIRMRLRGSQDVTRNHLLTLQVLMPATTPDDSMIFVTPLPIRLEALDKHHWGAWFWGPHALEAMRKAMVLDDLASI